MRSDGAADPVLTDDPVRTATLRRVTARLVPYLMLLYLINYLDRVNIGFAGPAGMNRELGLTATAFGFASGIFFVGYLLLEVPSNLALHRFGARRWIARILATWGLVATAMAFVPDAGLLYLLRFLLGVAEAGFFPGIILYLTYWFPKAERARIVALFMVAVPVSTALGSTLSALLISSGQGVFGLSGWRFMFLVEGVPSVLLAVVTWFVLTDRPADARWLADEQRRWLADTMDAEHAQAASSFGWSTRRALTSGRTWALALVYFGIVYGLYALGFFLPTIIAGFSQQYGTRYSLVERGLINSVPYLIGAVLMVVWARHGDRRGERVWHVALPTAIGGLAIPVALYLANPLAAMVAVTVCAVGVCCALPTFWSLPTEFLSGAAAAAGIGLVNAVGNTAGFVAPYVTGALRDATGSQRAGLWAVGGFMLLGAVVAVLLRAAPRPAGSGRSSG